MSTPAHMFRKCFQYHFRFQVVNASCGYLHFDHIIHDLPAVDPRADVNLLLVPSWFLSQSAFPAVQEILSKLLFPAFFRLIAFPETHFIISCCHARHGILAVLRKFSPEAYTRQFLPPSPHSGARTASFDEMETVNHADIHIFAVALQT